MATSFFFPTSVRLFIHFFQVLTAPHMEHGTQWAGRGQSSARMLPAYLWFQPQLILPQSFPSSVLPCIPNTGKKSTPMVRAWFWLAASLFWKLLIEAHFQLTVLWSQSGTFAPFQSGLSVHRHTEPNLHHTGGVKGVTMGQLKKKNLKRVNEITKKQHKNSTEEGNGEEGTRKNRTPESINVGSVAERIVICLPLCLYAW